MTTHVAYIDVDLGATVDSIIADNLTDITDTTRATIDAAIADSKAIEHIRTKREQTARAQTDRIEAAYAALLEADAHGETIAGTTLMVLVQPEITNMNSLVQRLRGLLKAKEDPRKLTSMRRGRDTYYYLADN